MVRVRQYSVLGMGTHYDDKSSTVRFHIYPVLFKQTSRIGEL